MLDAGDMSTRTVAILLLALNLSACSGSRPACTDTTPTRVGGRAGPSSAEICAVIAGASIAAIGTIGIVAGVVSSFAKRAPSGPVDPALEKRAAQATEVSAAFPPP
jgi:hypothetical protein